MHSMWMIHVNPINVDLEWSILYVREVIPPALTLLPLPVLSWTCALLDQGPGLHWRPSCLQIEHCLYECGSAR